MWIWLTLGSALLLGTYDVAKKVAVRRNDVYYVLLVATGLSTLFLCPFLSGGTASEHLSLVFKALLVTTSWVSGMVALKLLPITTVSTLKASRPMFVVLFSILLFGERLNPLQWLGVLLVFASIWLLGCASSREGIKFSCNKGILALWLSIFAGVASALWDKHIISNLQPLFVQSWTNLYITAILGVIVLLKACCHKSWCKKSSQAPAPSQTASQAAQSCHQPLPKFRWDWSLLLIAVFITLADALYFFALKDQGAMLSVVSIIRRCSVIVSFVLGAILFKEKNLAGKALALFLMLGGIILTMFATV